MSRLQEKYNKELKELLKTDLNKKNIMEVPRLDKIVVNSGVGAATQNIKLLDKITEELSLITGQKASVRKAKKSIATFRLREGMPIGATVTLRNKRMYEFFDRLVSYVIPRIKDFRGLSPKSFDGRGNYTMAIRDQLVFPEIDYNKVDRVSGFSITFVTSAYKNSDALALLKKLGLPIRD